MFLCPDWIELIWNRLNEFGMFNEFEISNTTLRTILRTCETVSRKNVKKKVKIKSPQVIYPVFLLQVLKLVSWNKHSTAINNLIGELYSELYWKFIHVKDCPCTMYETTLALSILGKLRGNYWELLLTITYFG